MVLIRDTLSYQRRYDLEDPYISSIWVNININRNHKLIACSYFRQWQLPSNLEHNNSNTKCSQINRYKTFVNQISRASNDKSNIIIMSDDNLNTLDDHSLSSNSRNFELKNIRDNFLIENSMVIHNKESTFFRNNVRSCIDHIFSNCPTHIDNVCTHSNTNTPNYCKLKANIINNSNPVLSDHSILSCNYTSKDICIPQQFKIIRNNKLLTKEKLQYYFEINIALKTFSLIHNLILLLIL